MTITLTDALVKRIQTLRKTQSRPALMLRVRVDGGGCQGFNYHFDLTDTVNGDDEVFEQDGNPYVVIDDISLPYMKGAEVDYADELVGAAFKINNPNAVSSCGCGTSFSIAD